MNKSLFFSIIHSSFAWAQHPIITSYFKHFSNSSYQIRKWRGMVSSSCRRVSDSMYRKAGQFSSTRLFLLPAHCYIFPFSIHLPPKSLSLRGKTPRRHEAQLFPLHHNQFYGMGLVIITNNMWAFFSASSQNIPSLGSTAKREGLGILKAL